MAIVSSVVGSSTFTGWNLLSSAASFSKYFLYSLTVVAPMICISPLASAGFKILAASIEPSAPPAPIIVWISSKNNKTFPSSLTSLIILLILAWNPPRYFEPATIAAKSSVISRLSLTVSGTFPSTILLAMPSTIAVLPTPGSPIRHGLFFVLLLRI